MNETVTYPKIAQVNGIQGMVVSQFVIEEDGSLSGIKIARDIGGGCGEAVVNALHKMNEDQQLWLPGRQRGRAVKVHYTFPFRFQLIDDADNTTEVAAPSTADNPVKSEPKKSDNQFKVVDQMPRFPGEGCESKATDREKDACAKEKMLQYMYKTLRYPAQARQQGVQGTAVVQFTVGSDGVLKDFNIKRDPGAGCGQAALDVITSMNNMSEKWIPGMQEGVPVDVQYVLPMKFKLQSGSTTPLGNLNLVLEELSWGMEDLPYRFSSMDEAAESGVVSLDDRGRIIGLNLQLAGLRGHLSRNLSTLPHLTWINLENNHLSGSIPQGLSQLRKLEELLINGNNLDLTRLPQDYDKLKRLDVFDDSDNIKKLRMARGMNKDSIYSGASVKDHPARLNVSGDLPEAEMKKKADEKMLQYIFTTLRYPERAKDKGVEGMAIVEIVVNKDGSISDIELKNDPGAGCGDSAVWAIERMGQEMGPWVPAHIDGQPVRSRYIIPVAFKMQ